MSGNKKGWREKETICWDCQNYSRCSWSRGTPVKGWKATPTKYKDVYGGGNDAIIVRSFLVEECPHFKADRKQRTTIKEISGILGKSERSVYRLISNKGVHRLKDLLKEKGYILYTFKEPDDDGVTCRQYYLLKQ